MAQTVTARTQDGGVSNMAIGTFTGDGTVTSVVTGFQPRFVKLINLTDRTIYEWTYNMAATHSLKTVAAGTVTDDTASAITPKNGANTYRGFEIPAAIAINAKEFHFVAFG